MIVACCTLLVFVVFGVRLSFTVFFVALIEEFGWSRADTALIFSTAMIVFLVCSPLAGWALDRFGVRRTFAAGLVILAAGLLLSSRINSLLQLTLAYGVVAGLGVTILGLTMQASVIARWFERRRGVAIGLAFAGSGLGSLVITPLVEVIIRRGSWRLAYGALAGLTLAIVPVVWLLMRQRPADIGVAIDGRDTPAKNNMLGQIPAAATQDGWRLRDVLRAPAFWLVLVAGFGTMGPIRLLTVHQLAMMADAGIPTAIGARVVGVAGAMTAVTFVLAGWLSDRIGRIPTYALGGVCTIGAIAVIGGVQPGLTGLVWPYALLLGLGEGSRSSLVAATVSDMFAGARLGVVNGSVGGAFAAGAALLPWLGGVIFDGSGSYRLALWLGAATVVVSVTALWLARRVHSG